ncbi:TonB-dependent receptor [uncultured Brevundimonas sp.]|uniref:TonB-dependent receptor n=1 Tax=uncultured Brevundimonas sp. TaxID=213418 RepID=UPI0025E2E9FB|nr:TonB-dependent receptor [uncultured Brevundimonas sp.]
MASAVCIRARLALSVSATALFMAAAPVWAQTPASQADPTPAVVDDIIVTAQKREQSVQDVPIAVTALSSEALEARQIEGGSELLRAVPNVTFSKANFSMYNFSIRGIGTKAVSASSDPAVAVSFNNTPLIRNRLFEQEYLDVDRVEVLRGPQGTLYGRNATGGVVNMFPNLPIFQSEGFVTGELGNYDTKRAQAMANIPLSDTFALRGAFAFTKRDGFDYNSFNDTHVNDRDLFTTRLSARWEPTARFRANAIWEHFEEDDNRSRTGKQLCTTDPGPTQVGSATITTPYTQDQLSQGCLPGSLYSDAAYGAPNGGSFGPVRLLGTGPNLGFGPNFELISLIPLGFDPYEGVVQSRDLREIATSYDPVFRAKNDVVQVNLEFDLSDSLTLYSQTAYAKDDYYASQDYARYVSNPAFVDSNNVFDFLGNPAPSTATPGGIYTDPQLGPSDRILAVDISQSDNRQWYQEIRLQSKGQGSFNFSLGANYLDFKSQDDYYVFNNTFSLIAEYFYNTDFLPNGGIGTQPCDDSQPFECVYVDPNPLSEINGEGHNYFRSKNVIHTRSWAVFGEGYWDLTPELRLTTGLRYTVDRKDTTPYPSQLLLGANLNGNPGLATGGYVRRGYYALPDIAQKWEALTGRIVLDWTPDLSFTNDTLVYASLSRGYKGGGTNPPRLDLNPTVVQYQPLASTFEPEYVNAFEIGTKNTLLDGKLRLNATAFYYDYKDYQVSQIVDRISLNENFDAKIWGLEFETVYKPTPNFQIDANFGYLKTRVADGEGSIDVMNRTQGNTDWITLRPWIQVPSNCIAPRDLAEQILNSPFGTELAVFSLSALCAGSSRFGTFNPDLASSLPFWQFYGFTYDPLTEAPNGGRGFNADLGGNELPNSPNWTANVGAQYTWFIGDWDLTVRGDYYRQAESYFRVYNTEYDRLKGWDNLNLSVSLKDSQRGLTVQAYVKNLFDDAPIVDAFTNSDDTGLTTNVFTLDPRLFAVRLIKSF